MKGFVKVVTSIALACALFLTPFTTTNALAAAKKQTAATVLTTQPELTAKAKIPAAVAKLDWITVEGLEQLEDNQTSIIELPVSEAAFEQFQRESYAWFADFYMTSADAKALLEYYTKNMSTENIALYTRAYQAVGFDQQSAQAFAKRAFNNDVLAINTLYTNLQTTGK